MNYALCIIFGRSGSASAPPSGFPLYLCSLHLLLAQKSLPNSQIPFPVPKSRPLAKDAAPIPNALAAINSKELFLNKKLLTPNLSRRFNVCLFS